MTRIVFYKRNDNIHCVECSGHTGYAEHGEDIVCSALSSMVQSCALGLKKVAKANPKIDRIDDEGYYKIELPKNIDDKTMQSSQILLKTLLLSVKDLATNYFEYIKLEERDYVY